MGDAGLEQGKESSGNLIVVHQGGAECGALGAQEAPIDAGLAVVVEAWATLSEPIKAVVLELVRSAQ